MREGAPVNPNRIEQAKDRLGSLHSFLESKGVQLKGSSGLHHCINPNHPDKNPSATIKGEYFRCWACGAKGDVLEAYTLIEGKTVKEALRDLLDGQELTQSRIKPVKLKPLTPKPVPLLEGDELVFMLACVDRLCKSPAAIHRFAHWRGWKDTTITYLAHDRSLGLSGNGRLCFCYSTGVKYRNKDGVNPKVIWRKGGKASLWRFGQMKSADPAEVVVTEGETDAITLIDEEVEDSAADNPDNGQFSSRRFVIALPSAGYSISPLEAEAFRGRRVTFYPDLDTAGQQCLEKNVRILAGIASDVLVVKSGR
jgi:hypothetical protein